MISTTYLGQAVFLIPHLHDWSKPIAAKILAKATRNTGKTNREERFPLAVETTTSFKFTGLLTAGEYGVLTASLDAWDNRPVLTPFWPAVTLLSGGKEASVVGALKIWFEADFATYEIGTGAGPSTFVPSSLCMVAPVLWGRFDAQFPELITINGQGDHVVSFEVIENGSAANALRPNVVALTTSVVRTVTVPTLTVPFTWGANSEKYDVRIKRSKVGFGREDADEYYSQIPRGKQTINFKAMDLSETCYLLTLFRDRCGTVGAWRCPSNNDSAVYNVGRFYGDALTLNWELPAIAGECVSGQIEFIKLPTETLVLTGETPGVTIGGVPGPWFGYVVSDGYTTWRFTPYEVGGEGPGGTYEHRGIEHGTITEEINLQINDCDLTVANWAGSPFTRLRNRPAAIPLEVKIYEGTADNPTAAELIYTGKAVAPKGDGPILTMKLKGLGSMLDIEGPRYSLSPNCAAVFCDAKCTKLKADVQVTHALAGITAGVAEFGPSALPDHWFANGYAERVIGGETQVYPIVDSVNLPDGNLSCIFAAPVTPAPTAVEPGWVLVPGCLGTPEACQAHSNYDNFRGAPEMPKADPTMIAAKTNTGGKK
jgi:hypothetical protein